MDNSARVLIVEPYLHIVNESIYNPLTDITLDSNDPACQAIRSIRSKHIELDNIDPMISNMLIDQGWLIPEDQATDDRFYLKYVSLEANIACNQACYFCPVSQSKRESHTMSLEFYEDILLQLDLYRDTIKGIFMNHYNEPTLDRYFIDRIKLLKKYDFAEALLTNGTGLTPKRIHAMMSMGGIQYLCVNLSAIDAAAYQADRGFDHLNRVLKNLDEAANFQLAHDMSIVVLGVGDNTHRQNFEAVQQRFEGTRFTVRMERISSRGGYLAFGLGKDTYIENLAGCEQTGSRILQHLHINAYGDCLMCCQDYDGQYGVGNLHHESVTEVLTGARMAQLRRQVYGIDDASRDFMCRNCHYALSHNPN